jgi:DNA-binding transcriptional ArsR family regulator
MTKSKLSPGVLSLIAERLRVLAEPARLEILNALRHGELSVTELVDRTGLGQTNISKHLQLLLSQGFVSRRKEGLYAYYSVADRFVFKLCDLMCDSLDETIAARRRVIRS